MVVNVIRFLYPKGRGAFNVSNIVQLVEGGCERNQVPISFGSGAFNCL